MQTKIKKILETHTKLKFPHPWGNEELANWLTDLSELDGYYVGIAQSIAAGKPIPEQIEYEFLRTMKLDLQILEETGDIDKETFNTCEKYLKSLEDLAAEVKKMTGQKTPSKGK